MLISSATMHALDDIAMRERDVLQAYAPGALPERGDVWKTESASAASDPLSAAPPQDAYFLTAGDGGRTIFTRDGSFSMKNGMLVDAQGRAVLGYAEDGASLAPLRADPVDTALGFTSTARIDADGTVEYERTTIDPRSGLREVRLARIGRLALARFAPGTKLQAIDAQHFSAPLGAVPHTGRAGDGNFGAIAPYARESSGIDIDRGLQRLQEAYLALDAIRAAGKAQGGIEKTAMDLLK
jgi:flagellar hook protein FlgE